MLTINVTPPPPAYTPTSNGTVAVHTPIPKPTTTVITTGAVAQTTPRKRKSSVYYLLWNILVLSPLLLVLYALLLHGYFFPLKTFDCDVSSQGCKDDNKTMGANETATWGNNTTTGNVTELWNATGSLVNATESLRARQLVWSEPPMTTTTTTTKRVNTLITVTKRVRPDTTYPMGFRMTRAAVNAEAATNEDVVMYSETAMDREAAMDVPQMTASSAENWPENVGILTSITETNLPTGPNDPWTLFEYNGHTWWRLKTPSPRDAPAQQTGEAAMDGGAAVDMPVITATPMLENSLEKRDMFPWTLVPNQKTTPGNPWRLVWYAGRTWSMLRITHHYTVPAQKTRGAALGGNAAMDDGEFAMLRDDSMDDGEAVLVRDATMHVHPTTTGPAQQTEETAADMPLITAAPTENLHEKRQNMITYTWSPNQHFTPPGWRTFLYGGKTWSWWIQKWYTPPSSAQNTGAAAMGGDAAMDVPPMTTVSAQKTGEAAIAM